MDETLWFLQTLFAAAVSSQEQVRICCIWLPEDAQDTRLLSAGFDSLELAAAYAQEQNTAGRCVYTAVGTVTPTPTNPHGRGSAADVRSLVGLWADVDYGKSDAGTHYPPTEADAYEFIKRIGPAPSLIVHSGHGLQPWWLFDEPRTVAEVAPLLTRWAATLKSLAKVQGITLDSVGDAARVLRLPGTVNNKHRNDAKRRYTAPAAVRLVTPRDLVQRWDPHDLDEFTIAPEHDPDAPTTLTPVVAVELSGHSTKVLSKINSLVAVDEKFQKTWDHQRPELKSASEYDLALANVGVVAGLSDQEIADLILAFRERHGLRPEKGQRRSYLVKTIGKAKAKAEADHAERQLVDFAPALPTDSEPQVKDKRTAALELLRKRLGVPIARWIRCGTDDPHYILVLADGTEINMGQTPAITAQRRFRDALYTYSFVIPALKAKAWDGVLRALLTITEQEDSPDLDQVPRLWEWIIQHLETYGTGTKDPRGAFLLKKPFIEDGALHVSVDTLKKEIRTGSDEIMDRHRLIPILRLAKFQRKTIHKRDEKGSPRSRSYYRIAVGALNREIFRRTEGVISGFERYYVTTTVSEKDLQQPAGYSVVTTDYDDAPGGG